MSNFEECKSIEAHNIKNNKIKNVKSEVVQNRLKEIAKTVKTLEASVTEADLNDQYLMRQLRLDSAKSQRVSSQLKEARKENKQLLNILQQSCQENATSRSQIDISAAYSTMSMVNLQYKYEELLQNYESLLKILTGKDKELQKCYKDNESVRDELSSLTKKYLESESNLKNVCAKYLALKERKDYKINRLLNEKETLRLAHNQLVTLLHQQSMTNDAVLSEKLFTAATPGQALFLQEVQRSNKLQHENMLLTQEIVSLKAGCSFKNVRFSLDHSLKQRSKSNTLF